MTMISSSNSLLTEVPRLTDRASWWSAFSRRHGASRSMAQSLGAATSGWPALAVPAVAVCVAILLGSAVAFADLNAVFVSVSLLACAFILADFQVGVMLLIVVLPMSSSALFPHSIGGITGLNPLNLLLFGTLCACLFDRGSASAIARLPLRPLIWLYVFPIVIAALIGSRHAGEIPGSFHALNFIGFDSTGGYLRDMLVKPLFLVLFAVLVGVAVTRMQRLERFLVPMLASTWLLCLMAIGLVYLSGASLGELASNRSREFLSRLGLHANDLGRLYAIAYALMLFTFAKATDLRLRALLIVSMGVVVAALTLTFSRGAFVGFAIVNLLFLLSRRTFTSLLLGAMAIVLIVFLLPGAVYDRIGMGWDQGLNAISAGRVEEIWLPLLPELWRSPIYGNGLGSILWSNAMRAGSILEVTHPHNAYLQAALDMGAVGSLLLLAYFIHVWKGFRRLSVDSSLPPSRQGFYEGAAAGLVSFLVTGFAGSSLLPVPEQTFLWLAIGMMYGERAGRSGN